jgi:hypothetical protein
MRREKGVLMNPFDPLRYRGVFDFPIIGSKNLLPSGNDRRGSFWWGPLPDTEHGAAEPPANPPFTSEHVIRFYGWGGKRAKYIGSPNPGKVLDQQKAWIQIWLEKGRHEAEREQRRKAEKAARVSAKKSAQCRARAA